MSVSSSHADRVYIALVKNPAMSRSAIRAVLKAYQLLGYAFGMKLVELRAESEPLKKALSEAEQSRLLADFLRHALELLASRMAKLPERKRPQYTPEQRFFILRMKAFLSLTAQETARFFALSTSTILRWEVAVRNTDDQEPLRPRIQPVPPVRRMADAVRHLVQTMAGLGFGGNRKIAQTLARAGWKLSHETVRRIRKESSSPEPVTAQAPLQRQRRLQPRYPNHIWLADLTIVRSLFGFFHFHIAAVFDGFSRMPLVVQLFRSEPSALEMASLFRNACRHFGPPRHFVSDQGVQFTAQTFRKLLIRLGVRHRFGAIGKTGSIALIERFWRTLKELGRLRFFPPLLLSDLTRRLEPALVYYAYFRPHEGLAGATPAEAYFSQRPQLLEAASPPRASPAEGPTRPPFEVRFIDQRGRFPVLVRQAA